jgi:hypothetical protein
MADANCPICGSGRFYVKDPDDEFECYEFECRGGEICFDPEVTAGSTTPEIEAQTETFCHKCSWHGAFERLIKEEDAK